jgi:hypothetical protein
MRRARDDARDKVNAYAFDVVLVVLVELLDLS